METEHYYHMFANGDDAKDFIISEADFISAFNRFAVCAFMTGATAVASSVEDSHSHALLWGAFDRCNRFKELYESLSIRHIVQTRGSADGVSIHYEICEITDESYLMNVGTYVICQPTKDGKAILPEHYRYSTAALYFKGKYSILPWLIDENGNQCQPGTLGSLTTRERLRICGTKNTLPDAWLVCNGFILPTNYVDISRFESIYRTHKCFRVFSSSSKKQDEIILNRMSMARGVVIEDLDARQLCEELCIEMFGKKTTRHLTPQQRIILAQHLRRKYHLAFRQITFLVHVPESELRKYVR